ncbi:hypothetical protein CONPUDRAFT_151199, partial [Coniophora puteana RWD-64-598 SS2]
MPTRFHRPALLELVHSDVHDVGHLSMSGYRYWVSFINDYSVRVRPAPLHRSYALGTAAQWPCALPARPSLSLDSTSLLDALCTPPRASTLPISSPSPHLFTSSAAVPLVPSLSHRLLHLFIVPMPDADASKRIKALTKDNYASWAVDFSALARSKGFYRLLKGTETRPQDPDKAEDWDTRQEKAAGELMLSLSEEQRIHVKGKEDDPML